MARTYPMSELVTRCRRRANREGDESISPAEWKTLISEQYGELFSIVSETGLRYFEGSSTISTTGATSYTEPSDMLASLTIEYVDSAGNRRPLGELMIQETWAFAGRTGDAYYYAFIDDQIFLFPTPPSGQTYVLRYVPQSPDLSSYADATSVDVVSADGEAFLIWGVTVKALSKSEGDVSLAMQREEAARERLQCWAAQRAMLQPRRIATPEPGFDETGVPWDPAEHWGRG